MIGAIKAPRVAATTEDMHMGPASLSGRLRAWLASGRLPQKRAPTQSQAEYVRYPPVGASIRAIPPRKRRSRKRPQAAGVISGTREMAADDGREEVMGRSPDPR
jgi:hypothetical protein